MSKWIVRDTNNELVEVSTVDGGDHIIVHVPPAAPRTLRAEEAQQLRHFLAAAIRAIGESS